MINKRKGRGNFNFRVGYIEVVSLLISDQIPTHFSFSTLFIRFFFFHIQNFLVLIPQIPLLPSEVSLKSD